MNIRRCKVFKLRKIIEEMHKFHFMENQRLFYLLLFLKSVRVGLYAFTLADSEERRNSNVNLALTVEVEIPMHNTKSLTVFK